MTWTMAPVGSASFCSKEEDGEVGANLQRVQRGMVLKVSVDGRFLCVGVAPVAADSTPRQRRQGQGQ